MTKKNKIFVFIILPIFLILATVLFAISARNIKVDKTVLDEVDKAQWHYEVKTGIFNKTVKSTLFDDKRKHYTTVSIGGKVQTSEETDGGKEAIAVLTGKRWQTAYAYWEVLDV